MSAFLQANENMLFHDGSSIKTFMLLSASINALGNLR